MLWRKLQVQSSIPSRLITALMHTLGDRVLLTSCIALYITTIALNICVLGTYTRPVPRAVRAWCLLLVLLLLWQAFLTRSCCAGKESQSLAAVRTDEVIRIGRFEGTRLSVSSLPSYHLAISITAPSLWQANSSSLPAATGDGQRLQSILGLDSRSGWQSKDQAGLESRKVGPTIQ
jgi:hypothetical protein